MKQPDLQKHSFTLGHQIADISKLEEVIKDLETRWDVDDKSIFQLNLVLEELISNTMFYGFKGRENGRIDVDLMFDGAYIYVDIYDDAAAFDPTGHDNDTTSHSLEERDVGGLGILLTQRISEDLQYKHEDGRNKLHFKIKTRRDEDGTS